MEKEQFERLVEVMARMANGDRAATFELYDEFGSRLAAVTRRELRRMGVERVDPDDLNGLVVDACIELLGCASSWDPAGGALPWTWARHKLSTLVSRFVGQHADSLDQGEDARRELADEQLQTLGDDPEELEVLAGLAAADEDARLLREALERVTNARNSQIFLEHRVQSSSGDPSPANTVGQRHHMTPDAVRQVVKRTRYKLRALAAKNERFSGLILLAMVA